MRRFACLTALLCVLPLAHAENWPGWRGPTGSAVSTETNLPTQWSNEKNVAWKLKLPGRGASSPVVVGNRVYLTAHTTDTDLHVLAIDSQRSELIWDREIGKGTLTANKLHNMATPTAASDGTLVWVMFGTGDIACLDRDSKILWQRNVVKDYGEFKTIQGYGSSPLLFDGRLYIVCMQQGPSYVLALDAKTGKNVWKKDRNFESKDEAQDSYSSPFVLRADGRNQIVVAGAEYLNAYDPASGEQIWFRGGLKVPHAFGRSIAGATASEGVLLAVTSGFQNRGYIAAFKAGGRGDLTENPRLWTCTKFSPDCPTPVIYRGNVFFIRDDGIASCLDVQTGKAHWQERLYSANVKPSPIAADGKIYFMNGEGNCVVVKAAPKLEILATNELRETTISTPAVSQGRLYLRTEEHLYCVGK